jgi:hypothetical protein
LGADCPRLRARNAPRGYAGQAGGALRCITYYLGFLLEKEDRDAADA